MSAPRMLSSRAIGTYLDVLNCCSPCSSLCCCIRRLLVTNMSILQQTAWHELTLGGTWRQLFTHLLLRQVFPSSGAEGGVAERVGSLPQVCLAPPQPDAKRVYRRIKMGTRMYAALTSCVSSTS